MQVKDQQHALYRFYNDSGQLLYVGITNDPARRIGQHSDRKDWWSEVRGMTIEWHPDRVAVLAAERRAVMVENPLHNVRLRAPKQTRVIAPRSAPSGILWMCDVCTGPVANGSGYIHVSDSAVHRLEMRRAESDRRREEKARAEGHSFVTIDLAELLADPDIRWEVHHRACDPEPDRSDYWFDVQRARSVESLLDWTLHLTEKCWLQHTDWNSFVRDAVRRLGKVLDA